MNLTEIIQSATHGSATAAIILMLNNTSSAATPYADKQPVQTTISVTIVIDKPALSVATEPQLLLFDRHLKVPVITAPLWLLQRMEALRKMPPPTLERMLTQSKASAEVRKKLDGRQTASSNGRGNGAFS
jgi:hypothetical protein